MAKIFATPEQRRRFFVNSGYIALGAVLLALGVGLFIKPFALVTGGVSGLSIILSSLPGLKDLIIVDGVNMTMEVCTFVITWGLFLVGLIFLGKAFAFKTLLSSAIFTVLLPVVTYLTEKYGDFFNIAAQWTDKTHYSLPIIAAVFGGVLVGIGCALTFRGGGSTGGLDILALIIVKYVRRAKSSVMVFVFDGAVVVCGMFATQNLVLTLLGVTSAFIVALVIDKVFIGQSEAFIANIISDEHENIRRAVIEKLDRTCTIISARGGFTDAEKPMIMVSFTMREYAPLIAIVHSIDKDAFITVHCAYEIDGEGFTRYDVKKKQD